VLKRGLTRKSTHLFLSRDSERLGQAALHAGSLRAAGATSLGDATAVHRHAAGEGEARQPPMLPIVALAVRARHSIPERPRVPKFDETAEKVPGEILRAVSRQQISFGDLAEAARRAVWTSRLRVDRIAPDEIDFFSGLP
jgi:hypothetical protein